MPHNLGEGEVNMSADKPYHFKLHLHSHLSSHPNPFIPNDLLYVLRLSNFFSVCKLFYVDGIQARLKTIKNSIEL